MWWVMAQSDSRIVDFSLLRDYPDLVNLWTHATVSFEIGYALLIWNRQLRPLLVASSLVFWLLLALASGFVTFCLLMVVGNLAFVDWRAALPLAGTEAESPARARGQPRASQEGQRDVRATAS
jgi:hypothetical protein